MDDNKKLDSSLVTVILVSDNEEKCKSNTKSEKKHQNKSTNSKKSKTKNTSYKDSNINISQQIQVENKEFQCVINLNTNVYEHKSRCREKSVRKHRSRHPEERRKEFRKRSERLESKKDDKYCHKSRNLRENYNHKDRIVPSCNRRACSNSVKHHREYSKRKHLIANVHEVDGYHERIKKPLSKDNIMQKRSERHNKNRALHHIIPKNQTESRILLSPISSSPLQDTKDNISYEEISSSSLIIHEFIKKPTSYKRHRKHSKNCKHREHKHRRKVLESKLDTLIKRTKERERKLVEKSRYWLTSTPNQEFSSCDFPVTCSDIDISINSASTLILDTQYSFYPTENKKETGTKIEKLNFYPYSPSSPIREEYTPKEESFDYKPLKIKNEPTMSTEAYSPRQSPESTSNIFYFTDIKKELEIKSESLFSTELSPIYNENNNSQLGSDKIEFSKIETVKNESMFN